MPISSINPANGETLASFEPLSPAELEARLQIADASRRVYRRTTVRQRTEWLLNVADLLLARKDELARLAVLEMGKPIRSAVAEVEKCALACRYYADNAERLLAETDVPTQAARSYVRYEPFGVLLMIMPWNFPYWQAIRVAAPTLAAGNVGLLKHASNVPQCALAIQDLLVAAGFPEGVFQTLLIGSDQATAVIQDDRIAAVTLTGSELAGRSVAALAGKHLKKVVLELGGSDPFVVMPSADVERAAQVAVQARLLNNGQSCIAAKRFIIHEAVYERFAGRFVEGMAQLRVGDPLDPGTEVGPLATPDVLADLEDQVRRSVAQGAIALAGGERLPGPGNYYRPTVLAELPEGAAAACEETFGPVAALFRVASLEEALRVANDTPFGLGASAWTNEPAEQQAFVAGFEAGQVFINSMVFSDPRLPFGGVKASGFGRELGEYGLREFLHAKTVWIQ